MADKTDQTFNEFGMGGIPALVPIESQQQSKEPSNLTYQEMVDQLEELLTLAPGHAFQDQEAWRKMAQFLASEADKLKANEGLRKIKQIRSDE